MPAVTPPCQPARIAIAADAGAGDFNGMSHSGTWLYLRNTGVQACSLPPMPLVRFLDRRARAMPAVRAAAPAARPVTVAPNGRARLSLRWVSGPVYDASRCYRSSRVTVKIGGEVGGTPLAARLCGARGASIRFEQTPLELAAD